MSGTVGLGSKRHVAQDTCILGTASVLTEDAGDARSSSAPGRRAGADVDGIPVNMSSKLQNKQNPVSSRAVGCWLHMYGTSLHTGQPQNFP
jgi:hypothetical protein